MSASLSSSSCPGIDHFNPDPRKVVHISCRNRRAATTGYGCYLAAGMVDGTPGGAASGGYHGVGLGCGTVKGKDASIKILPQHPLHLFKQPVSSSARRQYLNAVQQLVFAESGEVQVRSHLPGHSVHNVGTGIGAHTLWDDVGVQEDHSQPVQPNRGGLRMGERGGMSSSTPPRGANLARMAFAKSAWAGGW